MPETAAHLVDHASYTHVTSRAWCVSEIAVPSSTNPSPSLVGCLAPMGLAFAAVLLVRAHDAQAEPAPRSNEVVANATFDATLPTGTLDVHHPALADDEDSAEPASARASRWLGFSNCTSPKDRETELRNRCAGNFERVEVPAAGGSCAPLTFDGLCESQGLQCERVCDWEGNSKPCNEISQGPSRDGSRIALCSARSAAPKCRGCTNPAPVFEQCEDGMERVTCQTSAGCSWDSKCCKPGKGKCVGGNGWPCGTAMCDP